MVSKVVAGIVVVIVIVVGGAAVYVLTRPPEAYELFYDYQVGEYYIYEMTTTTTMDDTPMENISSTHSMKVIAVEDNEITVGYTSTVENIGPPSYEFTIENAEVAMMVTMTNKGEMISWEIGSVVPSEYWDNVELYENSQMVWSQLLQTIYAFPEEQVSICQEWEKSVEEEIPWGPGMYMTLTGEGSAHLVGQEDVTVEAGTFDCLRIDYDTSVSGELVYDNQMFTINITLEGTGWYSKKNCAEIRSTRSMVMSTEADNYYRSEYLSETVSELIEYVTV